jgi:hypothetical protein
MYAIINTRQSGSLVFICSYGRLFNTLLRRGIFCIAVLALHSAEYVDSSAVLTWADGQFCSTMRRQVVVFTAQRKYLYGESITLRLRVNSEGTYRVWYPGPFPVT